MSFFLKNIINILFNVLVVYFKVSIKLSACSYYNQLAEDPTLSRVISRVLIYD